MIRRLILNIMYTNPQKREKLLLFMHSYSNSVTTVVTPAKKTGKEKYSFVGLVATKGMQITTHLGIS